MSSTVYDIAMNEMLHRIAVSFDANGLVFNLLLNARFSLERFCNVKGLKLKLLCG